MIFPTLIFAVEKWKFNSEYGIYVSTLGNFKDRQKRNLPIKVKSSGYCAVQTEKSLVSAHRLVMLTWRPIPNREMMTVDHLNHNKRDNSLRNLEWVSQEENSRRAERDFVQEHNSFENNNNLKVNGIIMSAEQAIKFISYNSNDNEKKNIERYIHSFIKDTHTNRRRVIRYNHCLERI